MNASKTTLTLALTAAIGVAGIGATHLAQAAGNPFAMQNLQSGYMVAAADDKMMEGKCGGNKDSAKAATGKAKSGKCGTGKCGTGKCGANKAKSKAAEGKCGGDKAKAMEGKCGGNK